MSTTNQPKPNNVRRRQGASPVRERCILFIKTLKNMGYEKTIPLNEAMEIFQNDIGIMDAKSLRAYFGTRAGKSERTIEEMKRYGNGECKFRTISLSQRIAQRKGYLELLGLVKIEKRGLTWILQIQNDSIVPLWNPQQVKNLASENSSMLDLSLSSRTNEKDSGERLEPDSEATTSINLELTHTTQREREKSNLDNYQGEQE